MAISDEGRAVIDAARQAYGPSELDRQRVRGQLAGKIAATSLVSSGAKASTSMFGSVGAKIFLLGSITCVVGTAFIARSIWEKHAQSAVASSQPSLLIQASPSQPEVAHLEPALVPSDDNGVGVHDSALVPANSESSASPVVNRANTSRQPRPAALQPDVQGEIALLGKAQRALSSGQPAQALELLDEYKRTYPKGTLSEERNAARIIALCKMGQVAQARTEAGAFIRKSPQSPLSERVRASCGDSLKTESLSK